MNWRDTIHENKGLSGLKNLGNTCFINSCLQILSHTYELNYYLDQKTYETKLNKKYESVLLLEWDKLRCLLWSQNCTIMPNKFVKTVQQIAKLKDKDLFTGHDQNDLPEFLLFLIDSFHTALSRKITMSISGNPQNETDQIAVKCFETIKNMYSNDYSEIWNLFYGVHVSVIISMETNARISLTPEPYSIIDLPIHPKKNPSLIYCFNLYVSGEILEGEESYHDEDTNTKISVKKQIQFWSFPQIMIIDLKRFNSTNQKNQTLVSFPIDHLNLSEYVIGYKKEEYQYELYGVANHSGNVLGGHYTAFVKNANKKWYHFNDRDVTEVSVDNIVSPKAYCLFYRKKQLIQH
jgi:ubiquitin carboxyl-terminal hydrolase 8